MFDSLGQQLGRTSLDRRFFCVLETGEEDVPGGIFAIAYGLGRVLKLPFDVAAPAAMIGASNFFELAVAVAISLFGLESGAALATVVGVLVEVPVMLSLVALANRTQGHFAREGTPTL